jgi:hypothetical protein
LLIVLGFTLPFLGVMAWDAARWSARPGFWQQSALSYGGLNWAPFLEWGERWTEWLGWARYLAGSPLLAILLLLGSIVLQMAGWRSHPRSKEAWFDSLWLIFSLGYLLAHTVLEFSIWDRYLLPLAPLAALLLARFIAWMSPGWERLGRVCTGRHAGRLVRWVQVSAIGLIVCLALFSGYKAAANGYPIGGDHWAYQGLDEIAAYLQQNAPADAVLYHHWLRWHYSYYLYGSTLELKWWESGEHMQREALRSPGRVQYVVLPDWRTFEPDAPGLSFELLYQARRQDKSVSFSLYQVHPLEGESPSGGTT